MDVRRQVRGAPRALKETLEKGRSEYDAVVRQTRWGEGPLHIIGSGSSYSGALAGVCAFEGLLGWPVIASPSANFLAYSSSLIRPKSVVLAVSLSGEEAKTLEAALQARTRGATLLAMTASRNSPLADSADGAFLLRAGEGPRLGLQAETCLHAAMGYLAVVAARALKRHHHALDELEREFEKLPEQAEWVLSRLADAARSLASELKDLSSLVLVGGGFYHAAALQAGQALTRLTPLHALAQDAADFHERVGGQGEHGRGLLFLSGTRSPLKKEISESARQARGAGARVFAITDANDRALSDASSLAILLPVLSEMTGSTLALLFLQLLAGCLLWNIKSSPGRERER